MHEFLHKNTLPKGLLSNVPSKYTKKEVLNYYQNHLNMDNITVYSALIAGSFTAKFVLGIILNISVRFTKGQSDRIYKVFNDREEAIDWLQKKLATNH
jgi:hypothetical protein